MTGVFILSHIEKYASISFFTDEGEKDMYSEYIFDLSDKNVSDYVIYGKFTTSNMHIKGKWSVTFPLEKVRFRCFIVI